MLAFSSRCDGCHEPFKAGAKAREPVSVGCFHTLCRACAEGERGAYGALRHLVDPNPDPGADAAGAGAGADGQGAKDGGDGGGGAGPEEDVDEHVKALVRGRCAVCGGGDGSVAVCEAAVQALLKADDQGASEGQGAGNAGVQTMCEACEGDQHAATHFCEDCEEHLCDEAVKSHKRLKALSKHVLTPVQGATPSLALLCSAHQQPFLQCFCLEDKCPMCPQCLVTNHNGHKFVEVGEGFVGEMRTWLGEELGKAEARAGVLEAADEALEMERDAVTAKAREALNTINDVFDDLEKKRKELVGEVVKARKEACQRLNDARTTARALRNGIEAVQQAIQSLAHSPPQPAIQRAGQIGHQLHQLVEASKAASTGPTHQVPVFSHGKLELDQWRNTLRVSNAELPDQLIERGLELLLRLRLTEAMAVFEQCKENCIARGYQAGAHSMGLCLEEWSDGSFKFERVDDEANQEDKSSQEGEPEGEQRAKFRGYSEEACEKAAEEALAGGLRDKAAEGNYHAQLILGVMYFNGVAVERDEKEAAKLFGKAASQGNTTGHFLLCYCQLDDEDTKPRALEVLKRAADAGNLFALAFWGILHVEGNDDIEKNEVKGVELLTRAVESGSVLAALLLCVHHFAEEGEEDKKKGLGVLTKAADQGWAEAQWAMGELHLADENVQKDHEKARHFLGLAAEQGHQRAASQLAKLS